jgi:hypothetical protein
VLHYEEVAETLLNIFKSPEFIFFQVGRKLISYNIGAVSESGPFFISLIKLIDEKYRKLSEFSFNIFSSRMLFGGKCPTS